MNKILNLPFNKRKSQLNKQQNRDSIILASRKVFTEKGLDSSNVREIVSEAGLGSGTFYNYFDDFKKHGRIDENPIYNKVEIDEQGNTLGDFTNARVQIHPTSFNGSNDAQFYDSDTSYSYSDNHAEEWILSRRSKVLEMSSGGMRIEMKVRGYCNLCVGDKVELVLPVTGNDHGEDKIDKFTLLSLLNNVFQKGVHIEEDFKIKIDRSLNSYKFRKETGYKPLEWEKAIEEMRNFGRN